MTKNTIEVIIGSSNGFLKTNYGRIVHIELTEEIATLMNGGNVDNRKKTESDIARLVTVMKRGEFSGSNDMIVIDDCGHLRNGQHRITAFLRAGCPKGVFVTIYILECKEEDAETFVKNIDIGRPRKYADTLALRGIVEPQKAGKFETLSRKWCYLITGYTSYPKFLASDYDEVVINHKKEFYAISTLMGCRGFVADMAVAAAHCMYVADDHGVIPAMIKQAVSGYGLVENSPEYWLHEAIINHKIAAAKNKRGHNSYAYAVAGNCFIAKLTGNGMTKVKSNLETFIDWLKMKEHENGKKLIPDCVCETYENYKIKKAEQAKTKKKGKK